MVYNAVAITSLLAVLKVRVEDTPTGKNKIILLNMSNGYRTTSLKSTFTSIVVRPPFSSNLSRSDVHILGNATKAHLFRHDIPFPTSRKTRSRTNLTRMELLSPSTASQLDLKSDNIRDLRFRLYGHQGVRPGVDSYIALSYRWSDLSRANRKFSGYNEDFPLPTSPTMFQAILNERQSEDEGLWVDQICINQEDEAEKAISIGMMDTIYKSARVVVIALDDVAVTDDEAEVLEVYLDASNSSGPSESLDSLEQHLEHGSNPTRKSNLLVFHDAVKKIIESQYFERAWCHHELRLGRNHIFIIPRLNSAGSDPTRCHFIRFNGAFLYYIVLLYAKGSPSTPKLERIKRDFHSIFSKIGLIADLNGNNIKNTSKDQLDTFHSFTHSIAEVFDCKAGGNPLLPTKELRDCDANFDKMSIALNAVDSGLILRKPPNEAYSDQIWTLQQCQRQMMLVALAAGDPVVLCTTGLPLKMENEKSSWLCWPHSGEIDIGHFSSMSPLPADTSVIVSQTAIGEFIELDLLFIHSIPSYSHPKDSPLLLYVSYAQKFIDQCIEENIGAPSLYWDSWRTDADAERKSQRNLFTRTLAAIFTCGRQWIIQVSVQLGMDHAALSNALSYLFTYTFEKCKDNWWRTPDGQGSAKHVLEFLRTVTGKNLKLLPSNLQPTLLKGPTGHLLLTFISSTLPLHLAIPAVLTGEDYDFLSRCWVLSMIHGRDGRSNWRMLGKSRIFGVCSFSAPESSEGELRRKQRVYGPESRTDKR